MSFEFNVSILDHGYLRYVEHWGSDERIVEAARMSTGKGFLGWESGVCPTCDGTGSVLTDVKVWDAEPFVEVVDRQLIIHDGEGSVQQLPQPCASCEGKGAIRGDTNLIRTLWVNKHATPFEMAGVVIETSAPIMVYREWHRHRTQSYNEMSGRYIPLPDQNYVPTVERLLINQNQRTGNKQTGTIKGADELTEKDAIDFQNELRAMWLLQERFYQRWLKRGVPKELARVPIGVGRYSRMRASANLRNWLAFLTLRCAPQAQWEIRQYANELQRMLGFLYPRVMQLYMEGKS